MERMTNRPLNQEVAKRMYEADYPQREWQYARNDDLRTYLLWAEHALAAIDPDAMLAELLRDAEDMQSAISQEVGEPVRPTRAMEWARKLVHAPGCIDAEAVTDSGLPYACPACSATAEGCSPAADATEPNKPNPFPEGHYMHSIAEEQMRRDNDA